MSRCFDKGHRLFRPVFLDDEKRFFFRYCKYCPKVFVGHIVVSEGKQKYLAQVVSLEMDRKEMSDQLRERLRKTIEDILREDEEPIVATE